MTKTLQKLTNIFGRGTFSTEVVNTGRQIELDLAKGFAILFMIWVHTLETFGAGSGLGYELVEHFLGGPFAAPVFMVCMGIGITYARQSDAKTMAKRGLHLLWTGLLLNVFRYVLPLLLGYVATSETFFLNTYTFLVGVDILQFAGLAFLFMTLAKWQSWSNRTLLLLAVGASLLGMALKGFMVGNLYIDQLFGYIWADEYGQTYFPFLNWIIFPVFGYVFGQYFRHCADKKAFYLRASTIDGGLGLAYLLSAYFFKFGMYGPTGYYYFLGTVDALAVLLLVVGVFGACYLLLPLKDSKPLQLLREMSNNINTIYCIQWLLIGNAGILLSAFLPEKGLNFAWVTIFALVIVALSVLIARAYLKKPVFSHPKVKPIFLAVTGILIIVSLIGQTQASPIEELFSSETEQVTTSQ